MAMGWSYSLMGIIHTRVRDNGLFLDESNLTWYNWNNVKVVLKTEIPNIQMSDTLILFVLAKMQGYHKVN